MKKTQCINFTAQEEEMGFSAAAVGFPIFTEADTFEELRANIKEAIAAHFEDEARISLLTFDIILQEEPVIKSAHA